MSKAVKFVGGLVMMVVGSFFMQPWMVVAGRRLMMLGGLEYVSEALMPGKPRATRSGQDIEFFGTVEQRRIIYGTMKVSGLNVIPPTTSGVDNKYLHQALALAGHQVNAISDVYFDQVVIDGDASPSVISPVTGTTDDGKVVSGAYANKAWIRRYTGAPSGSPEAWTADYKLANEATAIPWGSNHRGKGIPYLALTFEYDEEVYKTGKPEVSCIVQGAKCYDPRLDVTPGASPTNPSYSAATANPALCLAHYLTNATVGMGETASRIDWDTVVAAANICDENVAIPPGSPQTTQDRYTCNVVLEVAATEAERRENIRLLAGAMMGHVTYRGSQWRMYAGTDLASSFALTDDDVVGKMTFRTELPSNEKYNYVRGQFVDVERNWQLSEFEPRSSSAYETTDGDRKVREVSFPTCTNKYEAQRNAIIVLKRSRLKRQVTLELGMSAYRIRPWDVGTLTLAEMGWTAQSVRCLSWGFSPDGMIEAVFQEEDSTVWADPAVGDYGVQTATSNPTPGDFTPSAPVSLTASSINGGIAFSWQAAGSTPSTTTYKLYEHTASTPFGSASAILTGILGTSAVIAKSDTTTRYYWIAAVSTTSGNESGPYPAVAGTSGVALTSGVDGLNVASAFIYQRTTTGTPPTLPSASATYTFATGAITGLNNGWTDTVPAISGSPENHYLWMSRATASSTSATDAISSGEWQSAVILAQRGSSGAAGASGAPGDPGDAGYNTATLYAYKRAASPPSNNPGALTYTFATAGWQSTASPETFNGWTKAVPAADGNPLYVVVATAYANTSTDSIGSGEWSSPVVLAQDGAAGSAGSDGLNVATAYIYRRTTTSTPPTLPSASATYTFATGDITGLNNSWTDTVPAITGSPENHYLWLSLATASATGATDTIGSGEWQAAVIMSQRGTTGVAGATGDPGDDGYNTATLYAYKRAASPPGDNPGGLTYTFATAARQSTASPETFNGWTAAVPAADGNPLYVVVATAYSTGTTDAIGSGEWSSPVVLAQDGAAGSAGSNGLNAAAAFIYQRTTTGTPPTLPSATATYTFATGAITSLNNGWTDTIPAITGSPENHYLWVAHATASATGATDTISSGEWSSAVILSQRGTTGTTGATGAAGSAGYNAATLTAYKRSASPPGDTPGQLVYTFATAGWTPGNSWSKTIPAGSNPCYAVSASAYSQSSTDTIEIVDWSSPALILQDGAAGAAGDDGLNVATAYIYQRTTTSSPPALPSATATYTFATGDITSLNNGWTDTVPAITGSPENHYLWVSLATASAAGTTDTIGSGEWQAAVILSQRGTTGVTGATGATGAAGSAGYNAATLTAYKRSASSPGDNPGDLTYTFATAGWTPGNSWSKTIPAADGNPAWAVSATAYSTGATDAIGAGDWSSPVQVFADGAAGAPGAAGLNVASAFIYQRTTTDSAPTLPSATATYTFATGDITSLNNGWTDTIPAVTGSPVNKFLWVSTATASSTGTTDTIASGEWAAAQHLAREGADGAAGAAGAAGADGLTGTISRTAFVVRCDAAGTPESGAFTDATGVWKVYAGTSDVTSSATYAKVSATNCTADVNTTTNEFFTGAKGAYRITGLSASSGYVTMTATYGSKTVTQIFSANKAVAGAGQSWASDTTIDTIDSGTYAAISNTIGIGTQADGTLSCSAYVWYTIELSEDTNNNIATIKVQYRDDGGTWTDFPGASDTGTAAFYIPGDLSWTTGEALISTQTTSAPASASLIEFRLMAYRSTGTEPLYIIDGVLSGGWVPT